MRLDLYLIHNNMVKSRSQATDLIKRGLVLVDDNVANKAGMEIDSQSVKIIQNQAFVSRAGEKLLHAILDFGIDFNDKMVVDIGSSTGGFTDCALRHGAKEIYAYDVGKDQMDESLRRHPKIHLYEETNILSVNAPVVDIIMIDVSFTSIKPILNHIKGFKGEIIALIKPQFEAGHIKFKQGVLKDLKMHEKILNDVLDEARNIGFDLFDIKKSGLKGKTGNQEYVLYIKNGAKPIDISQRIKELLC